MSEFYLVSSLPALVFGETPALTTTQFLRCAQGVLREPCLEDLRLLLEKRSHEAETDEGRAWDDRETQIQNTVARHRASKIETQARAKDRMHAGFSVSMENQVEQALSQNTPLEREKSLDHVRWKAADEKMQADAYGFGYLVGYAVQLQIAQRWAELTKEKGRTEFHFLVEHNILQLKEWV